MEKRLNGDALVEALLALVLAALFGYAILRVRVWPYKAALFPTIVGIPGVGRALVVSVMGFFRCRSPVKNRQTSSGTPGDLFLEEALLTGEALKRTVIIFSWIFGAFLGSWLLGQKLALPLFVLAYLKVGSREGWMISLALTLGTVALLLGVFDQVVHVAWHEGELFHWLGIDPL